MPGGLMRAYGEATRVAKEATDTADRPELGQDERQQLQARLEEDISNRERSEIEQRLYGQAMIDLDELVKPRDTMGAGELAQDLSGDELELLAGKINETGKLSRRDFEEIIGLVAPEERLPKDQRPEWLSEEFRDKVARIIETGDVDVDNKDMAY